MIRTKANSIINLFIIIVLCSCIAYSQGNTTSDSTGFEADDIFHRVDGGEVVGKILAFDGAVFAVETQDGTVQMPRSEVTSIALGQPQLRPKLLYIGSDTDDLANAAVGEALEEAGFDLTSATRLPASLEGFDVVVLESVSASSPDAAKMLRSFVGKGGGVVLAGKVPRTFCPEGELNYYCFRDENGNCIKANPCDTSAIADWVGGSTMESVDAPSPRIAASIANPFFDCPDINVGEELYVFEGDTVARYFVIGSLSAQARPVAKTRFEIGGNEFTGIAAFAYPFGEGRTYFQSMSYEPNHPKLVELLVAGSKWTAGILPEIGG